MGEPAQVRRKAGRAQVSDFAALTLDWQDLVGLHLFHYGVRARFLHAGQRCSALRLLLLPHKVAGKFIDMIAGAARKLKLGDPAEISTHVGPVIDKEAQTRLLAHIESMKARAKLVFAGSAPTQDTFVAPHIVEIATLDELNEKVFGPILHVYIYDPRSLDAELKKLVRKGYRLTLGIRSRSTAWLSMSRMPSAQAM